MRKTFYLLLVFLGYASGQTLVDLSRQSRRVDFSNFSSTAPVAVGAILPATCNQGEIFINLMGISGANIYVCTTANVWTAQSSLPSITSQTGRVLATDGIIPQWISLSGDLTGTPNNLTVAKLQGRAVNAVAPMDGQALTWNQTANAWEPKTVSGTGGAVVVKSGATTVGTTNTLGFTAGSGMQLLLTNTGGEVAIQPAIDSAVVSTRSSLQNTESLQCNPASTVDMAFTCSLNPVLASYATGQMFYFVPDKDADGTAVTIDVDGLGARGLKLSNGTSNPASKDFVAGQFYAIWYDGTVFRLLSTARRPGQDNCVPALTAGMDFTCGLSPVLSSYPTRHIVYFAPDKDADGTVVTINMDALGAVTLNLADGVTTPSTGDFLSGQLYPIWFDGSVFRLLSGSRKSYENSVSRPACDIGQRGRLWFVPGATDAKDELAICAKDAANAYNWRTLY